MLGVVLEFQIPIRNKLFSGADDDSSPLLLSLPQFIEQDLYNRALKG